ncbi:MAG: NADH-quinone oxidoreductase subunit M, partial [Nitrospinae bacterium]|nr:NADH-quinone oxidoreductase subunit M [Nitrospinota bacterium]
MAILMDHLISWMVAVPFLGIVILAFVRDEESIRRTAFGITIVEFFLSLILCSGFDSTLQGMQFVERVEWMSTFNIQYAVGVDGISILMVLLTALLCPLCVLCSWTGITTRVRAFLSLILLVEGAMIVVFTALDLFLFFMLW